MNDAVTLRRFPYPYRCALSLCSDIDDTPSTKDLLALMRELNLPSDEGGLGLEVGCSFWFYRNSPDRGISYFDGTRSEETDLAGVIRELNALGYADTLHTYGDFNGGGFQRGFAETACNEIAKRGLSIPVWVNHGNAKNSQNIGPLAYMLGGVKNSDAYHLDLTLQSGFRYFWLSQITHCVGQSRIAESAENRVKNFVQQLIPIKNRGRQVDPFFDNALMKKMRISNEHEVNAFVRFVSSRGNVKKFDIHNLRAQLTNDILDQLCRAGGFMIVYTHLGSRQSRDVIPPETRQVLQNLAERFRNGETLVTTTSKLLRYYESIHSLTHTVTARNERTEISLRFVGEALPAQALEGITFYTPDPARTVILFNGEELPLVRNEKDETGRYSVSVPWRRLIFPASL